VNRTLRIAAWAVGILLFGYFIAGSLLYRIPIGLEWSAWPGGQLIRAVLEGMGYAGHGAVSGVVLLVLGTVLLMVVVALAASRSLAAAEVSPGRRRALATLSALGAAGLASAVAAARSLLGLGQGHVGWSEASGGIQAEVQITHPEYPDAWKEATVQGYRRLGRTEWRVSDIVVGSGRIGRLVDGEKGSEIVRLAVERGVTYVDTSPDYSATGSEEAVADALHGLRDRVFLATKFCTPWGHLGAGSSVADYKRVIEESLGRLRTDYVDLAHVHACDSVDRLMDPNLHEAADRLREEGKLRFLGFSTHTPNLVEVAETAIASDRFDVMMLAYHHGVWPEIPGLIQRARNERDMGVIAMKTLKGAKHHGLAGFREHADSYSQAALRWVLSNPEVSAAVISFFDFQHVDEYLRASGGELTGKDKAILGEYDRQILGSYCAPHCGACLPSCPEQIAIHEVLRHRMYFEDYGDEKEAMRLYAALERDASACASCAAPCAGSCPLGVPIRERMADAHELLTLA
jgi:hypothetical protein